MTSRRVLQDVPDASVRRLTASWRGRIMSPADPDYDTARRVWNAHIDRRPGLILVAQSSADVARAVRFAADEGVRLAVRGGGHNVAGWGTCEGGIVLDLARLNGVTVDAHHGRLRVGGGARWGDVDGAAWQHGLGVTGGMVSTTGVSGLTLGGGIGWLMRAQGLTCDRVSHATVVLADGRRVKVGPRNRPDLFWALRGGGGNFGVVTEWEFQPERIGPLEGGLLVYPIDRAEDVLGALATWATDTRDMLIFFTALLTAPPAPFVPEALHGKPILIVAVLDLDPTTGSPEVYALARQTRPEANTFGRVDYPAWQTANDPLAPRDWQYYWKAGHFPHLSETLIRTLVAAARAVSSPLTQIHVHELGGAVARVPVDATAVPWRNLPFAVNVVTAWTDADADRHIAWTRDLWQQIAPESGGVYVNFTTDDDRDRVRDTFGAARTNRLAEIKARYDPGNVFRLNHNVLPADTGR
jgi:FAD/FMN-containing dehydrogenase